jgi:hypothetical protein
MERSERVDGLARRAHLLACLEGASLWGTFFATRWGGTPAHVHELVESADWNVALLRLAAARVADLYGDSAAISAARMLQSAELEALSRPGARAKGTS